VVPAETVSVAVSDPCVDGVKTILIVQVALAANTSPFEQFPVPLSAKSAALGPVIAP
jgi:hypothetical protein